MNVHKQNTGKRMTKEKLELHINILAAAVPIAAEKSSQLRKWKEEGNRGQKHKTNNIFARQLNKRQNHPQFLSPSIFRIHDFFFFLSLQNVHAKCYAMHRDVYSV